MAGLPADDADVGDDAPASRPAGHEKEHIIAESLAPSPPHISVADPWLVGI